MSPIPTQPICFFLLHCCFLLSVAMYLGISKKMKGKMEKTGNPALSVSPGVWTPPAAWSQPSSWTRSAKFWMPTTATMNSVNTFCFSVSMVMAMLTALSSGRWRSANCPVSPLTVSVLRGYLEHPLLLKTLLPKLPVSSSYECLSSIHVEKKSKC